MTTVCRCTAAELEELAAVAHPASALARALGELAELRGRHGGWEPPSSWHVVSGDSEEAWLAARDGYLTASDVASYIKLGKYARPSEAVRRKATRSRLTSTRAMRLGQHLESGILDAASEFTGRRFVRVRSASGASVLVAHPTIPRLAASLDGVELDDDGHAVAAVEVKCTGSDPASYYGWATARCQLQVQMACAGLTRGHIVVNSGTRQRDELDIAPRPEFVERLPGIVERFWADVDAYREEHDITDC